MSAIPNPAHQANNAPSYIGGDLGVRVRRNCGRTDAGSLCETLGATAFFGKPARFVFCAAIACCGLLWLMTPHIVRAGSGGVIPLPIGNARPKNALRLSIDTRWVDANGYRPVRIEAINWPPGPTTADRTIRVELSPQSRWGYDTPAVIHYIEIPEKSARATSIVSVPQRDAWTTMNVEVYEDGVKLDDLSTTVGIPSRNRGFWTWSEAIPAILIIDDDAKTHDERQGVVLQRRFGRSKPKGGETANDLPDVRYLAAYFPNLDASGNQNVPRFDSEVTDSDTLQILEDLPKVEMLPPGELPTKWIDFSCFDLIFVPFGDLMRLVDNHPDQWRAIRDWVATGPTLCVYDMPLDSEHLAELEDLLDIPSMSEPGDVPGEFRGWSSPDPGNADDAIRGLEGAYNRRGNSPPWQTARKNKPQARMAIPEETPFVSRSVDMGRVFALRTGEPFSPGQYGTGWLLNDIGKLNWAWYGRHGMSLHRENENYWNLMIPGVGRAPVNSYLVLITLFVVVIGPVNYYLLRRKKRLYLLLVTVPVGAVLVTFALMNYALITDGLGTRVRARSYATIDQTTGRAVSWSRQTYYAGLAPSAGLSFPSDTAFYPIDQAPTSRRYRPRAERWLAWDEEQNLTDGYLHSRTMTQFMVVDSHRSERGLRVVESDGDGTAPRVTNDLGADIAQVVLCDASGKCYWAEKIESGQQFRPQPIDRQEAARHLRIAKNENRPAFPIGYDSRYYRNAFGVRRRSWTDVDQSLPPPKFEDGILERSIHRAFYSDARNLKPRSYLAITETTVEVPLGYHSLQEEASFHVIHGRW